MARKKKKNSSASAHLSPQFLASLSRHVQDYQGNPANSSALAEIRKSRLQVAQFWTNADTRQLKNLYSGMPGKAVKMLLASNIQNEPLTPDEEHYSSELSRHIENANSEPAVINYLMATMLYRPADQLPEDILEVALPPWFMDDFAAYLLRAKNFFSEKGEVERYRHYMEKVVKYFHDAVYTDESGKLPDTGLSKQKIAALFTNHANMISLYFGHSDLKDIMLRRAELAETILIKSGCPINHTFTGHTAGRDRIRLGILSAHYNPQTETYATLPVFEYLDRSKYEVILYGTNLRGHALEHYCQSRADKLVELPKHLSDQVQTIREADLDLLFIGSNVTAIYNHITRLAANRLAPVQVTSICSPVTTGIRNIDYYIAGDLTVSAEQDQSHYSEQLVTVPGSGLCFSYAAENNANTIQPARSQIGIPEEAILYVSGANFFKITPALRETWTRIIAEVPGSLLVLYPFNPYWSRSYPAGLLFMHMQKLFSEYGIDQERLVILKPFPQRSDIKALLKICDVYLDAFPYGGATSIIDPLETGLPPVVMDGEYLRFKQASALLQELQMPELITRDEDAYRKLAITLGMSCETRERLRKEIEGKMECNPPFLDSKRYAEQISTLFENLLKEPLTPHESI